MKSSLKYIILSIILSLSGIFAYQLYWIRGQYEEKQRLNREAILLAIKNADHIDLFHRADYLSSQLDKERETITLADNHGQVALTTQFPPKDSLTNQYKEWEIADDQGFMPKKMNERTRKILKSNHVKVGDDFASLGLLGLQMQKSLHEIIDTLIPINLARFDSILGERLKDANLPVHHYTEIRNCSDSTLLSSSVPEKLDLNPYDLYTWEYASYQPKAFYVYTEPIHLATLRQMTGILISSFLILLILVLSFAYMLYFLIHQKTVEQLKDDFTHNVTHELKTPIAIICAAIEALIHYNATDNKEKSRKYLHVCHEEIQRLGSMVEQILSLSLEHKKEFHLKFEKIHLQELISRVIEQQTIKAGKTFQTKQSYSSDVIYLEADRTHLYNIISNLLDNAIKYSGANPLLHIQASYTEDSSIEIRIEDNGPGIQEEHLKHIFEKFYRTPQLETVQIKGYGIGLFYVKTMIEKHNGRISVESIPGKGSCFTLLIPQKHEK